MNPIRFHASRSKRVPNLLFAGSAVLFLSTVVYAFAYLLHEMGDLHFYSIGEHALLALYAASCYAAVELAQRVVRRSAGARAGYWVSFLASALFASIFSSIVFVGMRIWVGGHVTWPGVLSNIAMVLLMFHFTIAGVLMARRYVKERDAADAQLRATERDASQLERKLFQQQFEPHFLFNNLNILSALIRPNPAEAEVFAERLANVYRHLLRHRGTDLIPLDAELQCARDYAGLASLRFGDAYRLVVAPELENAATAHGVVPGLLLELLGNLMKHNHAPTGRTLELRLALVEERLVASNVRRPRRIEHARGEGLSLLSARYRMLAGAPMDVRETADTFEVRVPMMPFALA